MNRKTLLAAAAFLLLPLAFVLGRWTAAPSAPPAAAGVRRILYYVDPMNPSFRSSEPGTAPCGMPLEPVYADETGGAPASAGAVAVRADRQQLIGVRVETVSTGSAASALRLLGRVASDESRLFRLYSVTAGWIRETGSATTGSVVRRGEVLARFYAPEFASPQQSLIYQVETLDKVKATGVNPNDNLQGGDQLAAYEKNISTGRLALISLGMSPDQADEVIAARRAAQLVDVRAPSAGIVLARNVSLGQRFEPSTELYTVADLGHVWILADAFEGDARRLKPGAKASVTHPALGRTIAARVSSVPPQFDATTRTLKVRLEAENPGYVLRPDMFVDVELPFTMAKAISVPKEAVLDSGTRKVVYVRTGEGTFEPRRVETGWREGDRVEIVSGLEEGEEVVTSGNFLLDSESRMRASGDEETPQGEAAAHAGHDHATPAAANAAQAIDPICGMTVDPAKARAAGLVSQSPEGEIFFCNPMCKKKYDEEKAAAKARS
jgi:RND family efflux transporter MFP subunit